MDKPLILVVEDEPISCEVLVDILRENGYETVVAGTGADAWDKINEHRGWLDAILLDRLLPDMDSLSSDCLHHFGGCLFCAVPPAPTFCL